MVSFIRIAFVVVKLNVLKVFVSIQHPWNGSFWVTPPNMVQYCWNSHQRKYSSKQQLCLKRNWRIRVFIRRRQTQSLHFWSNFDHPFLPEDGQNWKDIISGAEKLQSLGYPNMLELRLDLLFPLDIGPVLGKEFLDIGATVECRFAQKCVSDMVITYSQIYWGLNISF